MAKNKMLRHFLRKAEALVAQQRSWTRKSTRWTLANRFEVLTCHRPGAG
ncbi:hypothetical protein [Siminovitchia fordii]|nr:hypothetical protein [Siminovitchia fordii]